MYYGQPADEALTLFMRKKMMPALIGATQSVEKSWADIIGRQSQYANK